MLEVDAPETGSEEAVYPAMISQVTVSASNGASSPFWTLLLTGVFGAVAGFIGLAPLLHHRRRWRGTDWTDED